MTVLVDAYRLVRGHLLQRLIRESNVPFDLSDGVEVLGYLGKSAGISESARLCIDELRSIGLPVVASDLAGPCDGGRHAFDGSRFPRVRIFHVNPPMMPRAVMRIGARAFARTFNIGYWAWELETLPAEWLNALRYVNAVLVPSEFTRRAIARHTDTPVIVVPHPTRAPGAHEPVRTHLGIGPDAFLVSTIFNPGSSFGRKNPIAVVEAYRALVRDFPTASLILKTGTMAPDASEAVALRKAIHDLPRATVISEDWSRERIAGLITESDAYVSLHRSEGFGLTIAEAIVRGTPVVATNWSGNVDFCSPGHTWLVDAVQIPVHDDHPEFRSMRHATWAEPCVDHAARQLKAIAGDRWQARRTAALAADALQSWIESHSYRLALATIDRSQKQLAEARPARARAMQG